MLSNTNALEVPGMAEASPAALLDSANVGKMLALPGYVVDSLRAVEAFKATQTWGMFRRPGTLIREDTIKLAKILQKAEQEKLSQTFIVDGVRSSGKSLLLVQAMAAAFMKKWIVLNIPEAQDLTAAITDYTPILDLNRDPKSDQTPATQFSHNTYTASLLEKFLIGNRAILEDLKIQLEHKFISVPTGTSLARLAELGTRDPNFAWPFFQALWAELTLKGQPPILMALDGLGHACRMTAYRDPDFKFIHSLDFALLNHFFTYFAKRKALPNGGVVLAATAKGNTASNKALDLAIQQDLERQAVGKVLTQPDPYRPVSERDYEALRHAEVFSLGGLSRKEARGLVEYWAASGLLRTKVDEKIVMEKWTLGGHGVIGEMEKGTLRMRP